MNYFKDETGDVFAYDSDQVAAGLADDKTPMTPEEVEAHKNPPKTAEQQNIAACAYLLSTDWYIIRLTETGEPVPPDVLASRASARAQVIK